MPLYFYLLGGKTEFDAYTKRIFHGIYLYQIKDFKMKSFKKLKKHNPNGLMIAISPNATKEQLIEYIRVHYKNNHIRTLMGGQKALIVRSNSKDDKHKKIYRLCDKYTKKSLKDLNKILGKKYPYKWGAIAELAQQEIGVKINPDTLRTTYYREKDKMNL